MTIKYIKREDNIPKQINNKNQTLTELLQKDYSYIYESIQNEKYIIQYEDFTTFHEITNQNKVIGYYTTEKNSEKNVYAIEEIYILPEFRGNGIFKELLTFYMNIANLHVALKNPNKKLIDSLINNELAFKIDSNIIISFVRFYVNIEEIYDNKYLKQLYNNSNGKKYIETTIYDYNLQSVLAYDLLEIVTENDDIPIIIKARKSDINKQHYEKLEKIDPYYLMVANNTIYTHVDDIEEFMNKTSQKQEEESSLDKIIGTEDKLTNNVVEFLKKNNLTVEDGLFIRKQLKDALEKGEITNRSKLIRFNYLIEHYGEQEPIIDTQLVLGNNFDEECPYCKHLNSNFLEACEKCGHNIQQNNMFYLNAQEIISQELSETLRLGEDFQLKEEIDEKENIFQKDIKRLIEKNHYDEKDVFDKQCQEGLYMLLQAVNEVYLNLCDFDAICSIRPGSIFNYAINNEYIEELEDYDLYYLMMQFNHTLDDLIKILEKHHLPTNGSKTELINRIQESLTPEEAFGKKYAPTEKGYEFLENNPQIKEFTNELIDFIYYEYFYFIINNNYEDIKKATEDFRKHMEDKAIKEEDYELYLNVIENKLDQFENHSDYERILLLTELFIIDLNYWFDKKEREIGDEALGIAVQVEYPDIIAEYKKFNANEIFNKAYENIKIKKFKKNKALIRKYFIDSLKYEDIDELNNQIEYDTYNKKLDLE